MTNWNRLFMRQGFLLEEVRPGEFDCRKEQQDNMGFLLETLDELFVDFLDAGGILKIRGSEVDEADWVRAMDFRFRGRTENIYVLDQPVRWLDTYIAGAVRQLNRLSFVTGHSCDGHGRRAPVIGFKPGTDMKTLSELLTAAGMRHRVRNHDIVFREKREFLLDLAEELGRLPEGLRAKDIVEFRKQLLLAEVERCLGIDGASGLEQDIREYVIERMKGYVDHLTVDGKGNILAQKSYGTGGGTVLVINAHLDTVEEFAEGREILKDGEWWTSSDGILGADDRAGVAALIQLARWISTTGFSGTIKFIFTVEEEKSLSGAREVSEHFLWGADAAFVLDRRGAGDIVTSYGGFEQFCDGRFGEFIADTARAAGLQGWKTVAGGSSDTRIWASHGLQSVNLSIGYQNEHTENEMLNVEACFNTVELVLAVLRNKREMMRVLREIRLGDGGRIKKVE